MFGLSIGELLTVLIITVLIFGAKRLPELGKGLGEGMRGFRDALKGIDEQENPAKGRKNPDQGHSGDSHS